jgi:putative addiction module component (TIGR02574 family)
MLERNNPLIHQATALSPLERLQLVDYILESLDMPDKEIGKLWADEASRRWEGYKGGISKPSLPPHLHRKPMYWHDR